MTRPAEACALSPELVAKVAMLIITAQRNAAARASRVAPACETAAAMAVCPSCRREMLAAPSCTPRLNVVRYGDERYLPADRPERCRDCGVSVGGVHHPRCCMEECGRCGGQLLTCEHLAPAVAR
jgi:hypothetical protein